MVKEIKEIVIDATSIPPTHTPYTMITFKATRKPQWVNLGLPKDHPGLTQIEATEAANRLHDASKIFSDHGFLDTGVSIMVVTQGDADAFIEAGRIPYGFVPIHQCGGW